jgi:hypothetical protein
VEVQQPAFQPKSVLFLGTNAMTLPARGAHASVTEAGISPGEGDRALPVCSI